MSNTNFRLESFRPWNPFQDKAQPLRDPPGACRYPSPVSITATPPPSNSSDKDPKSYKLHSNKPERHPLPARPPTEVCLDSLHSETQTTRREWEGSGRTPSTVYLPQSFDSENILQPQNIVCADDVAPAIFADGVRWDAEHQPLGLESGGSEPTGFAGQQPQIFDSEDDAQNGELPGIEIIDPAILNGNDSQDAEQPQTAEGIATIREDCPARSTRSQEKASSLQRRRQNSKATVGADCQLKTTKRSSPGKRHINKSPGRFNKSSGHRQSISFPTVRAQFSALSVEDRLQFLSWLFEGALSHCASSPSSPDAASPSRPVPGQFDVSYDCDHTSLNTERAEVQGTFSRKGQPWSGEEDHLLTKLREKQELSWSEVIKQFSRQFPGRSKGSIQVYWSTTHKKKQSSVPLSFD
ncbi:hypothetical protein N7499_012062 [Penicillium canescens]|uniref:Myb-like domain-containing protein n=1 Tax=Penicillium canescens TaxID=5083 RepID=A0AAD6N7P8_PENCN|nr:uncharacterized protein N7446_012048 [Penicillium canescens]KAJ6039010.1 hypothetical protein N7460_007042 [Penicillium canescens]KAJ6047214.1 hypothetical protein N7446_012048 [Penicillium canescens]KAJ6060100.1 hypothetical protein N7444_002846 [Penicillium canescens]KAJ6070175.1 hypothetical protein N7499_012062 [Penicillium canescens]KAJ6181779.1 hypothetical protein N7485_000421 [Penicillium canescens]